MPASSLTPAAAPKARIAFLDYLRIFAFASVLVGHKFGEPVRMAAERNADAWHWPARLFWPFIEGGGAGVVVFFLVSGYIITQVIQRERTAEFLIKRALRIYPLYVVAVLSEYALLRAHGQGVALNVLVPQLLLLGDVLGAPYALAGVEWTLRLELSFYLLMAVLRSTGLAQLARVRWWVLAYLLVVLVLYLAGPLATHSAWSRGYVSLFLPFLLLGSMVRLCEQRAVGWPAWLAFAALVLVAYRWGLHAWQPRWLHAPFPVLALALFMLLWGARRHLPAPAWVLALSELTYAVYLFHNWLFDVLRDGSVRVFGLGTVSAALAGLAGLLAVCWALVRLVEQPAIRWGRRLAGQGS